MDYYNVLGVNADETDETIKASYRKLAKQYHPDANPGDEDAARCFREVAEAYSVLGDADKRAKYDKERKKAAGKQAAAGKGKGTTRSTSYGQPGAGFDYENVSAGFERFFGFNPQTGKVNDEKLNPKEKSKAEPIDVSGLFERYMGIKK
ncbi:DnaJ domain-containing protein [Lacrimispora brassicae]